MKVIKTTSISSLTKPRAKDWYNLFSGMVFRVKINLTY